MVFGHDLIFAANMIKLRHSNLVLIGAEPEWMEAFEEAVCSSLSTPIES